MIPWLSCDNELSKLPPPCRRSDSVKRAAAMFSSPSLSLDSQNAAMLSSASASAEQLRSNGCGLGAQTAPRAGAGCTTADGARITELAKAPLAG